MSAKEERPDPQLDSDDDDEEEDLYEAPERHKWEAETLGRVADFGYDMLRCLYRGHTSVVWSGKARPPLPRNNVVIKMQTAIGNCSLPTELAVGLASAHPNIAPVVAWHWLEADGFQICVSVMDNEDDYIDLADLIYPTARITRADWLAGKPHANGLRKRLCLEILRAVVHLHDALHLAHRDIKPGNIVVTKDLAKLRIIDYGFSVFLDGWPSPPVPEGARAPSSPTVAHALGSRWWETGLQRYDVRRHGRMGTLGYMAPETLYCQDDIDLFKADMYSVGVVIYEVFFACEPWGTKAFYRDLYYEPVSDARAETLDDEHWRRFDAKYPLCKSNHVQVDPQAWTMIETLMQSNPKTRPTASQALAMFQDWLTS